MKNPLTVRYAFKRNPCILEIHAQHVKSVERPTNEAS